jgi:hypothetical protein
MVGEGPVFVRDDGTRPVARCIGRATPLARAARAALGER